MDGVLDQRARQRCRAGALPLITILVLDVSAWQVSMLAVAAGIASAAAAVPLAPWIEVHRKRPVMIAADLVRFTVLASVPVAAWLGALSYLQLCVVAAVQTGGAIVFGAASGPTSNASSRTAPSPGEQPVRDQPVVGHHDRAVHRRAAGVLARRDRRRHRRCRHVPALRDRRPPVAQPRTRPATACCPDGDGSAR